MNQHDNIILKTGANLCRVHNLLQTERFLYSFSYNNPALHNSSLLRFPLLSFLLARKWNFVRSPGKSIKMVLMIPMFGYDIQNRNIFISRDFHHWYFNSSSYFEKSLNWNSISPSIILKTTENLKNTGLTIVSSISCISLKTSMNRQTTVNYELNSQYQQVKKINLRTFAQSPHLYHVIRLNNFYQKRTSDIMGKSSAQSPLSLRVRQSFLDFPRQLKSSIDHKYKISDPVQYAFDIGSVFTITNLSDLHDIPKDRLKFVIFPFMQIIKYPELRTTGKDLQGIIGLLNKYRATGKLDKTSSQTHWLNDYMHFPVNSNPTFIYSSKFGVYNSKQILSESAHSHSKEQATSWYHQSFFSESNHDRFQNYSRFIQHRLPDFPTKALFESMSKSSSIVNSYFKIHSQSRSVISPKQSKPVFSRSFFSMREKDLNYMNISGGSKGLISKAGTPEASGNINTVTQASGNFNICKPQGISDFPADLSSHHQLSVIADKVARLIEDKYQTDAKRKGLL